MNSRILLPVLILVSSVIGLANEQVRVVQEELRKRKAYFGDIDGKLSRELSAAIGHFQKKRGLEASGAIDGATLDALGVAEKIGELSWPEGIVLRSDAASPKVEATIGGQSEPAAVTGRAQPVSEETFEEFLKNYLRDAEKNNLELEMSYYAEQVDYFEHGVRDRNFVRRDEERYYERWPRREYALIKPLDLTERGADLVEVQFGVEFAVRSEDKPPVRGKTRNCFVVNVSSEPWKIVSLKEERVRP